MIQKHRISANIGQEQKVVVELKQDYDLLEILSLKFTQEDVYRSLCSDYGVVCGRVSVNNGLGVPNAKVSIFIPLSDEDQNDPVISTLYPYTSVSDKNNENYRYNLLPSRKQHGGHEPTGTFPDQTDILTREEVLEVYEKYYIYTVKTNTAGDFMIWGVPIGPQTLHIDVDLSDMGCFSLRPYDFIRQGYGVDSFKNTYEFKSSNDIDSLPQIKSFDKTIEVFPFWGNTDLCEIGITRTDFDLSSIGVKVEPKAFLIGGTYTDIDKNSVNKNCQPRRKMGRKCDLATKTGKIESIRFTTDRDENNLPILEFFDLNEDIPEDGSFVIPVPMNMDYVYTNEFGENVTTNDPNKGIATSACYRFRFSLDDSGNARVRKTANYLVPNIREYWKTQILGSTIDDKSYAFSTDLNDYPTDAVSTDSEKGILYNVNGEYYPRDYFYRMTYNKVYTVSSFHSMYYSTPSFTDDRYVGIKELVPTEEEDCSENLTPPVNYGTRNRTFALLIADVVLLFEHITNLISFTIINSLVRIIFILANSIDFRPFRKLSNRLKKVSYRLQEENQKEIYLISYPDCENCNLNNDGTEAEFGVENTSGEITNANICGIGNITVTFLTQGQSTSSTPTYYTSSPCTPSPTFIPGSTTANKNTYFVQNQSQYYLIESQTKETVVFTSDLYFIVDGSNSNNLILVDRLFEYAGVYNFIIVELKDTTVLPTVELEGGCKLFDTPYNEKLSSYFYINESGIIKKIRPNQFIEGMEIVSTNISNDNGYSPYYLPTEKQGDRVSGVVDYYQDKDDGKDIFPLVKGFDGEVYVRKTTDGQSEFKNGVFTIVPGAQTNKRIFDILKEFRRRKRVAKMFCGGIVNYSFIDNWMSGSLYFFLFKAKKGKYCSDIVRYIADDDKYYYRSTKYLNGTWGTQISSNNEIVTRLNRPTTLVDLGPRDEFIKEICIDPNLDPNCSVSRSVGATSFKSFGELLGLAINYRMDVSNGDFSLNGFFNNKGFNLSNQKIFAGDILQLISINNEAGIEEFDLQSPKYICYSYQYLDPENPKGKTVFYRNGAYGPLPITFYLEDDGERIRACLNEPGRLTESSQIVPFFLWDKQGYGFGPYNNDKDQQSWYYNSVQTQPLQGMTYGYKFTSINNDVSDKYLLLPMTYDFSGLTLSTDNLTNDLDFDIIDDTGDNHNNYSKQYPGFTYLYVTSSNSNIGPTAGILYTRVGSANNNQTYQGINIVNGWHKQNWNYKNDFIIRPTLDYYNDTKQILSTPFMFYFGLKAGKTGLDKFIQYFGDKGAFTTVE